MQVCKALFYFLEIFFEKFFLFFLFFISNFFLFFWIFVLDWGEGDIISLALPLVLLGGVLPPGCQYTEPLQMSHLMCLIENYAYKSYRFCQQAFKEGCCACKLNV